MDTDNTPFGGKIMFSAESETGGAASDKAPAKSKSEKASINLLVEPLTTLFTITHNSSSVKVPEIDATLSHTAALSF